MKKRKNSVSMTIKIRRVPPVVSDDAAPERFILDMVVIGSKGDEGTDALLFTPCTSLRRANSGDGESRPPAHADDGVVGESLPTT